jgi:hypothetical protein
MYGTHTVQNVFKSSAGIATATSFCRFKLPDNLLKLQLSNLGHLEFTMFLEGQLREDAG